MNVKRIFAAVAIVTVSVTCLSACGSSTPSQSQQQLINQTNAANQAINQETNAMNAATACEKAAGNDFAKAAACLSAK